MSDASKGNLYQLVLGLPEDAASPNHYELLGLDARTSDPEVIKSAAADQNRKLLAWQNSDRYAEVRRLTFEIVHAMEVLLNEASRAAYDAGLGDWGIAEAGPWVIEEPAEKRSSEPLSVRCPECAADFKLRNRDLIGRRMPCPECGFRFTVRPEREPAVRLAEVAADDADWDAELAELENFDDMEDLPHSRSQTAARPSRQTRNRPSRSEREIFEVEPLDEDYGDGYENYDDYEDYESAGRTGSFSRDRTSDLGRKKSPSRSRGDNEPAKWPIALGGLLMAVGVVVLAGVFVTQAFAPQLSLRDQLKYLPEASQAMGYLRVGDLSRSPFFQDHLTRDADLRDRVDQFRRQTGMELEDVDSLTIGLRSGSFDQIRMTDLKMNASLPSPAFVAVARANRDWDRSKLIGGHTASATHQGQNFHEFSPPGTNEQWALYLPDARTVVFGSVEEVKAAIETEGKSPDWPAMEFLEPNYPIVAVQIAGEPQAIGPRPGNVGPGGSGSSRILGSGFLLEDNQGRHLTFLEHDSEAAAAEHVEKAKFAFEQMKRMRPPRQNVPEETMDFRQDGRVVTVIEGGRNRFANSGSRYSVFAPIGLLAHLGKSEGSPDLTNRVVTDPVPLAQVPSPDTLDSLIRDLNNPRSARQAAQDLAKRQPDPNRQKEVAARLENVIRTGEFWGKMAAVDALGVWGSPDNVPFLLGVVDGDDAHLKQRALEALGRLRDPRALPILFDSLQKGGSLQFHAANALKLYGPEAEPELLRRLAVEEIRTQNTICEVLKEIGTARSLPQLDALSAHYHAILKQRAKAAADAIRNRKP